MRILLLLAVLIGLALNSGSIDIEVKYIEQAQKLCANNGGVHHITTFNLLGLVSLPDVTCNNKAEFKAIQVPDDETSAHPKH
jgi:hypothetical protein